MRAHDVPEKGAHKAVPYGIYDLAADAGWVSVGCDGDTAAFAVATLRRWWNGEGRHRYPPATRLLICADAGGANGYRVRAWKQELAGFAHASGLQAGPLATAVVRCDPAVHGPDVAPHAVLQRRTKSSWGSSTKTCRTTPPAVQPGRYLAVGA